MFARFCTLHSVGKIQKTPWALTHGFPPDAAPLIPGCHPAATLTPARSRFLDAPGGRIGDEGLRGACYAGKSPRTMEV